MTSIHRAFGDLDSRVTLDLAHLGVIQACTIKAEQSSQMIHGYKYEVRRARFTINLLDEGQKVADLLPLTLWPLPPIYDI